MKFPEIDGVEFRLINRIGGLYCFGSDGSVWSRCGRGWHEPRDSWTPCKMSVGEKNYRLVSIHSKTIRVHRLVCEAFHGECLPNMECCHRDGDPSNNSSSNLRWDYPKNNIKDREIHGTTAKGERHGKARLTEDAVREIRRLWLSGKMLQRQIANQFGIAEVTVSSIVTGRKWKHIT
jgi:hypothetical protein